MYRTETRRQRYDKKSVNAKFMPVSFCAVNFGIDENLALLIRTAACYGAESVMVIGSVPDHSYLRPRSGSTVDYIKIIQFATPHDFLQHCRDNGYNIVSAELCEGATDLNDYNFKFDRPTVLVMGNEYTGVPSEIIYHSDPVFIQMNGIGFCLNTMTTGAVFLNEYQRQFVSLNKGVKNAAA